MLDLILSLLLRAVTRFFYEKQARSVLSRAQALLEPSQPQADLTILVHALVCAEDHRFYSHYGVDLRAIVRAIVVTTFTDTKQGGSTITQQLTRVITCDFRRTLSRKFKELCIAAWLDSRLTKQEQAVAYLHLAYFGWRMNGWKQAASRLHIAAPCSVAEAASIVARLKYPEPRSPTQRQMARIQSRKDHIVRLMGARHENSSRTQDRV